MPPDRSQNPPAMDLNQPSTHFGSTIRSGYIARSFYLTRYLLLADRINGSDEKQAQASAHTTGRGSMLGLA